MSGSMFRGLRKRHKSRKKYWQPFEEGDLYEDCSYAICRLTEIEPIVYGKYRVTQWFHEWYYYLTSRAHNWDITGIVVFQHNTSKKVGDTVSCSLRHCAPVKLVKARDYEKWKETQRHES